MVSVPRYLNDLLEMARSLGAIAIWDTRPAPRHTLLAPRANRPYPPTAHPFSQQQRHKSEILRL
jgi:hypothetical protein